MKNIYFKLFPILAAIAIFVACKKNNDTADDKKLEDTWLQKTLPPNKVSFSSTSFVLNGKGYTLGSSKNNGFYKDLWQYDPMTNQWTEKASLPLPEKGRDWAASFVINGKAYICAGLSEGGLHLKDLWEYDPNSNTWTEKAPLPADERYAATSFTLNGKGYITTGISNGSFKHDLWEYDPNNNTWTEKTSLPEAEKRAWAVSFVVNNKAYISTGGQGNKIYLDDLWEYDPNNNTWTEKTPITFNPKSDRRIRPVSFAINDKAYILGGSTNIFNLPTILLNELWEYNANNDSWVKSDILLPDGTKRSFYINFIINNKVYLFSGIKYANNSQTPILESSFWQFKIE